MIFIFDFIFCPDDKEKFAANARNYDYTTHIIIIDFKEQEKKNINFSSSPMPQFSKKHTYIHINITTYPLKATICFNFRVIFSRKPFPLLMINIDEKIITKT